ncbi:hypothetical protein MtrunA17_Chr6g0458141 [Medicago truncatula]|uniref:Transmembrane protein n=1 Tax=Medicago truncatula TaxID=3880 RepID=A0A396HFA7_MEDTR|nr:hypothetical protein MtrunA17_Chr6g0458141 [Medicago truncatula]
MSLIQVIFISLPTLFTAPSFSCSIKTMTNFEFPTNFSNELPNDIVFCGKVITRKTETQVNKDNTTVVAGIRSLSVKENRYRRSSSKSYTVILK